MSLIPLIFEDFRPSRPSRILDQQFGMGLDPEDFFAPFNVPRCVSMNRGPLSYYRPWRTSAAEKDAGSTVSCDKDKFQVNLDVQHFSPEEITVKATGNNTITVEGSHEEKQDEHGFISRKFVRKYVLPEGHDIENVQVNLSSDGVLAITAPKINKSEVEDRKIPIQQTGVPSRTVEAKKQNEVMDTK